MPAPAILKQMSADEFHDWSNQPENRDRQFELERGQVVEVSRPGERHGVICGNVVWILSSHVRRTGTGYVCANDTGLLLERDPDTVRGPDVMMYRETRRFDELNAKYSSKPPALAVEVLSPSDTWPRLTRRISHFLRCGIALVLVVDPGSCSVTAHRAGHLPLVFEGEDEVTGGDALPDFRCKVAEFFYVPGEQPPPGPPPKD